MGFVHLSGPRMGASDWLGRLPATIGSGPDADLVVPGTAARHAVLFHREGHVVLLDSGSDQGTWMAGAAVHETVLRPGDVITLGREGPRLRFERQVEAAGAGAAMVPAVPPSQTLVLRALAQSSSSFRRAVVALALFASALFAWAFVENRRVTAELRRLRAEVHRAEGERAVFERRIAAERRRAEEDRQVLERRLEDERRRADELRGRLGAAAAGDVQSLKAELDTTRRRIATLESERAAGEQIIRQYGGGVCLIQGSYAFHDANGRPLRYRGVPPAEQASDEDLAVLTPDGDGPVHTVEYYGTGFLVRSGGLILTNRHVAEPWWNDATATEMQKRGYQARLLYLRAFFPRHSDPYDLHLDRASEVVDLALLRTATTTGAIPVLPLETSPARTQAGQPVVVVGYPTGLEAILAKADGTVVRDILESHGTDSAKVTLALARQGLIRPSTTQGHIGDITGTDIVFDAPSAQGGSGGPVFNKHGQVIAVEYAVLQKFGGNAFGIPIHFARDLMRQLKAGSRGE